MRAVCLLMIVGLPTYGWADDGGTPSPANSDRPGGAAGARAQQFADEAAAATRAASGSVPPAWRDVERGVEVDYRPEIREVTPQSASQMLAAQYRVGLAGGSYDQPVQWRRTEVEVVVAADGQVVDTRIVVPSGNAQLDRKAVTAAQTATRARSTALGSGKKTRVRFAIEAGVSVVPPEAAATAVPGTDRPNGGIVKLSRVHFDETTGRVSRPDYILKKNLHTRVSLIGIRTD